MLVCLVAYVADWASDYACDWWSDECVKFSRAASYLVLVGVVTVIGMSAKVYRDKGQIVLGKSLMGLGAETFELANVYWHKMKGTTPGAGVSASKKKEE